MWLSVNTVSEKRNYCNWALRGLVILGCILTFALIFYPTGIYYEYFYPEECKKEFACLVIDPIGTILTIIGFIASIMTIIASSLYFNEKIKQWRKKHNT